MQHFDKQGIINRLEQLDDDLLSLYPGKDAFSIILLGGSALVLRNLAPAKTATVDIDALRTETELEEFFERYDINTHVDTFRFQFPEHFEERLVEVPFAGTMLKVFTLSNEDLAITKLLSWREQDRQDLRSMLEAGNINLGKLNEIVSEVTELQANLTKDEWASFTNRLNELESWQNQ